MIYRLQSRNTQNSIYLRFMQFYAHLWGCYFVLTTFIHTFCFCLSIKKGAVFLFAYSLKRCGKSFVYKGVVSKTKSRRQGLPGFISDKDISIQKRTAINRKSKRIKKEGEISILFFLWSATFLILPFDNFGVLKKCKV